MDKKYLNLNFSAKIQLIEELNPEFTLCKCLVQGIGKNRNGSYMSKENIDKYINTLNYCPVVGHIIEATDPETGETYKYMGGHDFKVGENWQIINLTVPYGVVVNDSFDYEMIDEYGTEIEYLTANVILWTGRYPELKEAIYSEDYWFNQSMEINPIQYRTLEEDSNYIELLEWNYSALCLLGKADDKNSPEHTEPCFISSSVIPVEFSKNDFVSEMAELKDKLSFCFANKNKNEGGTVILDKKLEVLQKFNKTVEDLDFSIEEMELEELETKMEELFGEKQPEPETEPTPEEPEVSVPMPEPVAFSLTYREKLEALRAVVGAMDEVKRNEDEDYVEETYHYVTDFTEEYVFVEVNHWDVEKGYSENYVRYPYEMNEDGTVTLTGEPEEMVKVWLTVEEKANLDREREEYELKFSELEREYSTYKEEHSYFNADFDELKQYKETKLADERACEEAELFAQYEERIGGTDEFAELKAKASEYSIDELKKECVYIVGLYAVANEPKETPVDTSIKFSATENTENSFDPIEALFKKYLNK